MSIQDKIKLNKSEEGVIHAYAKLAITVGFVLVILLMITLIIVGTR